MNKKCVDGGGIYQIRNTKNNKKYIGGTKNLNGRRRRHKSELNNNKHQNANLQGDWNKHGESSFEFEVLELVPKSFGKEDIFNLEQSYLDRDVDWGFDYNISPDARSGWGGRHLPEEMKERLSEVFSGENNPMWGKTHDEETIKKIKEKIAKNPTRRSWSKKQREELSERQRGNKSYWWGKNMSPETVEKISLKTRGENNAASKKTKAEVLEIRELYATGKYTYKKLGEIYSISIASAWRIVNKINWKHI